jgi:AGZA family xanthine/uracil permease-like MFS transporter
VAAAAGGAAGISSNTSYVESAAGVAEGGRTGLTAVVVGVLFLVAILLSPLATLVPFVATGPVLVVVGYLMATLIKDIDFVDVEEGIPALLTLILMPLTFLITIGIGAGFISWVVIKVAVGKAAQVHPLMWIVAAAFVLYFAQALLPGGYLA